MNQIKGAVEEFVGMFVDDWRFAAAVAICVAVAYAIRHFPGIAPYAFVAGLATVLIGFTCLEAKK